MTSLAHNFDQLIGRQDTGSIKWDETERLFGNKDILPMWIADMDFRSPLPVIEALKKRAEQGIFGYTARPESYLQAVQAWMKNRHGWDIQKEWLCHSPGIITALNIIISIFTQPDEKVLIQPPVYPPFRKAVENQDREVVLNPLVLKNGTYVMDKQDLEQKLTDPKVALMILCSPHNPVGRVWTEEELRAVVDLCIKNNVLIVSDEIHSDLVFRNGSRHIPLAGLSAEAADHTIVCSAPSKTFNLAGLQISGIIIPNLKRRRIFLKQMQKFALSSPNAFGIVAAEAAYRKGGEWLDQCLGYIKGNFEYVDHFLSENIPELKLIHAEGTYLGWIDCRNLGLTKKELETLMLKKANLAFNQGYTFGKEGEGFERINLACPRQLVEEAMVRLERAVADSKK